MNRDPLLLGLSAVFAGIAVLMTVLAFTSSLFLLVVALPFGIMSYILWEHATGRLARRARRADARAGGGVAAGRGPRASRSRFGREARQRARAERARRGAGTGGRVGGTGDRVGGTRGGSGLRTERTDMSTAEAYRELDVSPSASQADVKQAYRKQVKEVHPDSGGDEEAFKRVNRAYDALRE